MLCDSGGRPCCARKELRSSAKEGVTRSAQAAAATTHKIAGRREHPCGSIAACSRRRAVGSIEVAARPGRRFPPTGIRNVVAIDTMNTCDHRILVETAAIVLGDVD